MADSAPPPIRQRPVLVTGCSSGIGLTVARGLAARGYPVFACARKTADVANLRAEGLDGVVLDLDDSRSIVAAVDAVMEGTGGVLYGLVNNAGYGQQGAVIDLGREALRAQLETNVLGTQELTNLVVPAMLRMGCGRIVQISSILGRICMPMRGAYCASKFALEALSDTMRVELAGTGIDVSIVEPGPVATRFRSNALAALERHVDVDNSLFRERYARLRERLGSSTNARFCVAPEAVLRVVIKALERRRPKTRYPVTMPSRVLIPLRRLLSDRLVDRIVDSR
jgi:NAD(P)-dependent dehydrogenase (short-subunit alcohol dehydrogenase family)